MLNHIVIMGRLTRDPELRRTGSGLAVANFCVAVERDFPNKDTGDREADFINCVAWRQTGEFVNNYFKKGSMIVVSGRLQIRNWTDDSGVKRYIAEIVAENVYFGESKKSESERGSTKPSANTYWDSPYYSPSPYSSVPYQYDPGPTCSGKSTATPFNSAGVKPAVQVPDDSDWMLLDDDAQLPF